MKWHDVASSEKYLNADADTQTQIQEKFYSQYVEPEAVKRGLDASSVRSGFFSKVSGIPQINSASDVEGGESILKSKDDFLASVSSPDQLLEWRSKGKIGVVEAYQKMNKWEMLPYLNAKAAWDSVSVLRDINRHQNGEQLTEEEKTRVSEFVSDMLEIEARGYSVPGGIAQGVLQLPAFAVEFATSGGLIKGVKFGLGKAAKQGIKGAISKAVNVSAKLATTGAARTALMPHRVAKTYADNMISDSISLTDKGEAVFKNADTKPATAAMKAFGDVWVEMVSEETGGVLLNPLFGKVKRGLGKAVPEKLKTGFANLVKETTDLPVAQAIKKGGFDGVLEEIGEERIGDLLRTTLDLDQREGYSTDQFMEAINPGADQFLIEAGIVGMWGGASKATQIVKNRLLSQGKSKEEVESIIAGTTEVERDGLAFGARDIETAETEALYTQERSRIVQSMADAGVEDAESIASLIDARVIALADAEGLPKYDVAKRWGLEFQRNTFDEFMGNIEKEEERKAIQEESVISEPEEPLDDIPFQEERGVIQFGKDKTIISLFEEADKSTVLHELGHLFLRDLSDYAANTKSMATQEQMATVRGWLGNDGGKFTMEQQEQFARGFEAYLLTGKAPTSKLEGIFAKFKNWLRSVYSSMKSLNVKMTPEIVRSFDSMLMTEAEKQATGFYDTAESGVFERLFQSARDFFQDDAEIQDALDKIDNVVSGRVTEVEGQTIAEIDTLLKIIKQRVPKSPETLQSYMRKNGLFVKESSARAMGLYDALKEMGLIRVKSGITHEDTLIEALRDFTNVYGKAESYDETSEQWAATVAAIEDARNIVRPSDASNLAFIEGLQQDIAEAEARLAMTQTKSDTISLIKDLRKRGMVALPKDAVKDISKQVKAMNRRAAELTKEGVKLTQQNVMDYIRSLPLSLTSKAKLMSDLKNAGVDVGFMTSLKKIKNKAAKLYREERKKEMRARIKRELKRTKPSKVSGKKVGKFDYETNKIFDTLREIHNLDKEAAIDRLVNVDDTPVDNLELIYRRSLSYKAADKDASLPIIASVLEDILNLKRDGREARDLEELTAKVNKAQDVDDLVKAVNSTSGDKDTFATKVGNLYRRGFANLYSFINAVSNKNMADKYDFERKQAKVQTAIFFKMVEVKKAAADILGLKKSLDKHEISVEFNKFIEGMAKDDYQIVAKDGKRYKLSKLDILDIYNAIKNDAVRNDYYNAYGEEQVNAVVSELTQKEAEFGDLLQEQLEAYYERINPIYVELYGLDMPEVKKYWPSTNEHSQDVDIFQEFRASAQTPGFFKERLKGVKRPIIKNAWRKFANHIAQAEHMIEMGLDYRNLALVFKDRNVRYAITEKFGEEVYTDLMQHIDGLSLAKHKERLSAVDKGLGEILNNWVVAKIALNPMIFAKQLGSITNYAEQMPVDSWFKYLFEGMANPKQTKDYMFKVSPYLEARYSQGYNESIERAIQSAGSLSKFKGDMTQTLTALVRMGDIGAVIYGGYPLVKYNISQGMSEAEAVADFERQTLKSQQAGVSSSLSLFQQNRAFANRFFLAFKNTPAQYLRKISDAVIMYQNGDISREQMNKTLISYLVVQPAIYAAIGEAMGKVLYDRDMEIFDEMMMQFFMNPLSAVPLLGDIINAIVRKFAGEPNYRVFSIPMLDDISNMFAKMSKKDLDIFDAISIIGTPIEVSTGLPIQTFNRMIKERFE